MTMLNHMDKATAKMLGNRIQEALQTLGTELGLVIEYRGGKFDSMSFSPKITCTLKTVDGQDATRVRFETELNYLFQAGDKKLTVEDFGKTFVSGNHTFTITGINPNREKYPVMVRRDDRKEFVFGLSTVIRLLGK